MLAPKPKVEAQSLLESARPVVQEVLAFVCRRCRKDEAEDFGSVVWIKLAQDDCAVLRQFGQQSTLKSYLSMVINNLFIDYRRRQWGVWRPCAEAHRLGKTAEQLDLYLHREGLCVDEAIERLRTNHRVAESPEELRALAARLPVRQPRRRWVNQVVPEGKLSAEELVEGPALVGERYERASALRRALREAVRSLAPEDALALRFRYMQGFTVAKVAEILGVPAKPLYERIHKLRAGLREDLVARGFDGSEVAGLIGDPAFDEAEETPDNVTRGSSKKPMERPKDVLALLGRKTRE